MVLGVKFLDVGKDLKFNMSTSRFTRARLVSINSGGGSASIEYTIPNNTEFCVSELAASSDTNGIKIIIQFSNDGGTTWVNPWDTDSEYLLVVFLAGYIPASAKPEETWFTGDGENTKLKITIINQNPSQNANVFYLIKATERTS